MGWVFKHRCKTTSVGNFSARLLIKAAGHELGRHRAAGYRSLEALRAIEEYAAASSDFELPQAVRLDLHRIAQDRHVIAKARAFALLLRFT